MAADGEKDYKPNKNNSDYPPSGNSSRTDSPVFNQREDEDYGYSFYPDRARGGKPEKKSPFWKTMSAITQGRKASQQFHCIVNTRWCMEKDPQVKLMIGALRKHGCPINPERHISCENCTSRVNGGYDPQANQVVICQNNSKNKVRCCSVLAHELVHAFDYCRAKLDFENLEHLACTEIRAANFMHCSFLGAWGEGDCSPLTFSNMQQECVKRKAQMSVVMVRNVSLETAKEVVDKVFDKCYKDLEPIGRIPRRSSRDVHHALSEAYLYGYI